MGLPLEIASAVTERAEFASDFFAHAGNGTIITPKVWHRLPLNRELVQRTLWIAGDLTGLNDNYRLSYVVRFFDGPVEVFAMPLQAFSDPTNFPLEARNGTVIKIGSAVYHRGVTSIIGFGVGNQPSIAVGDIDQRYEYMQPFSVRLRATHVVYDVLSGVNYSLTVQMFTGLAVLSQYD